MCGGGGAREGMHFSQSKNARLLNFCDVMTLIKDKEYGKGVDLWSCQSNPFSGWPNLKKLDNDVALHSTQYLSVPPLEVKR